MERSESETKRKEAGPDAGGEQVRISVRRLVEFILRHGDIDNRYRGAPEDAMQEGGRIHRMIQKKMGPEYHAEVTLKYIQPGEKYMLVVEGRADGIMEQKDQVTIDEIKGTYRDLAHMREPQLLHLAQAKCYAYMYGRERGTERIRVRMTYCNIPSGEIRYFYEEYSLESLEKWFMTVLAEYRKWADYSWEWFRVRQASIGGLAFPFPYRDGQRELVTNVYKTIYHKKKLFIEAPTGVGKTISTIYPAVQAMGKEMGEKIFYLTAKTITRTVAEDGLNLLREKGLRFKSVILTAKEKICFMEQAECSPETCPYARGHYDRVNAAVFDLLLHEDSFTREKIEEYAGRHQVCPFEMCLDMSLFSDAVICDYNYLFDPHIYLKRFFGEGSEGKYIFLIDEAHNLLERGREMYSAELYGEQFLTLAEELKKTRMSGSFKSRKIKGISGQMELEMTQYVTRESENGQNIDREGTESREEADLMIDQLEKCSAEVLILGEQGGRCRLVDSVEPLVQSLVRLQAAVDDYLWEQEEGEPQVREWLQELYFQISHFLLIYDLLDEHYVTYSVTNDEGDCLVKLFCVNPCENMRRCMGKGRSSILFSATLLPIQYYKALLGGDSEDYEVYARSVFDPGKRALLIAGDVTSKYTRRSEEEFYKIARYIEEIVKCRRGNYMVFCPSYAFLNTVYHTYTESFGGANRECLIQEETMSEAQREAFLARFRHRRSGDGMPSSAPEQAVGEEAREDCTLVGFCVLGGIFGEGIDLKEDSLIGAVIVGTGLPQIGGEKEILKWYFDENGGDGFDYAYRYPGMNKVLQAAGRVIRTAEDEGVIALLDERFLQYSYRRLFPREWQNFQPVTVDTAAAKVEAFWRERCILPLGTAGYAQKGQNTEPRLDHETV